MKNLRRFVSLLISIIMIITAIPFSTFFLPQAKAADSGYKVGDMVYFGSYPQSEVTDESTLTALNSISKTWISYNYYSGSGLWSDGKMQPSDYMKYCDITYKGDKYRAVTFSAYRPYCAGYSLATMNTYQDDNGYYINNVYYFKYEPIKWRILDPNDGFLLSEYVLDSQAFNTYELLDNGYYYGDSSKTYYASNYGKSSIRNWLNNSFYKTAFTTSEKSNIIGQTVLAKCEENSSFDSTVSYNNKVFLLTKADVENQYYSVPMNKVGTDYAKSQGLFAKPDNGCSWWWLRSPYDSGTVSGIHYYGYVQQYLRNVIDTNRGVVLAIKVSNLNYTYPQTFYAEKNDKTAYAEYKVGLFSSLAIPEEPEKEGYKFTAWYDYYTNEPVDLTKETMNSTAGRTFYAVYEPEKYVATLVADGKVIDRITYTYGQKSISLPKVPKKEGYIGEWEAYSLGIGGVTINAVYSKAQTEIHSVYIPNKEIYYREKVQIIPEIEADCSYSVSFASSDEKIVSVDDHGNIYGEKRGNARVTCIVTDLYGNVVKYTSDVNVKYSSGQWVIMLFLLGWLWY